MASRMNVISRVRKTRNTALFTNRLHKSMYVLKITKATEIQPRSLLSSSAVGLNSGTTQKK